MMLTLQISWVIWRPSTVSAWLECFPQHRKVPLQPPSPPDTTAHPARLSPLIYHAVTHFLVVLCLSFCRNRNQTLFCGWVILQLLSPGELQTHLSLKKKRNASIWSLSFPWRLCQPHSWLHKTVHPRRKDRELAVVALTVKRDCCLW